MIIQIPRFLPFICLTIAGHMTNKNQHPAENPINDDLIKILTDIVLIFQYLAVPGWWGGKHWEGSSKAGPGTIMIMITTDQDNNDCYDDGPGIVRVTQSNLGPNIKRFINIPNRTLGPKGFEIYQKLFLWTALMFPHTSYRNVFVFFSHFLPQPSNKKKPHIYLPYLGHFATLIYKVNNHKWGEGLIYFTIHYIRVGSVSYVCSETFCKCKPVVYWFFGL